MFALHRRGVRDCRHCCDDDLRRRLHGPRQAGRRCLDVSGAASCAVLQLCSTESSKLTMQPSILGTTISCVCGKFSVFRRPLQNWRGASLRVATWCSSLQDDATHTTSQRVAQRCSTSSSLPVQMGSRVAVAPPRGCRAATLPPRARCCANGHHRRKHRHGRDGVADEPEHGGDNLWPDRRLGHRSGDENVPGMRRFCRRAQRGGRARSV